MDKQSQAKALSARLKVLEMSSRSLGLRQQAHLALYRVALLQGDLKAAQQERDNLHTILDTVLDNTVDLEACLAELETLR